MEWQPIENAPKDGTEVALWCENPKSLLFECAFIKGAWKQYTVNEFDRMTWVTLEPYEVPTHFLRIVPPGGEE